MELRRVNMRFHWVDSLKGIGIMLVVLAHHSLPIALETYIFSFHVPLFFFISGFLFDFGKYAKSASNFVNGRFKSLIIPYFCFAVLTCIFYFLMDAIFQPEVTNIEFFKAGALYGVYSILYALGPMLSYNQPLWFLTCLFVTELLFYVFAKKFYGKTRKFALLLTAAGVIGYLYPYYVPFRLPWNADVALSAVVFYGAGNLFRKFTESRERSIAELEKSSILKSNSESRKRFSLVKSRLFKYLPSVFIIINLLYLVYLMEFSTTYNRVDMNTLKYGGFFSFYLLAFSGIFACFYLSQKIGCSKVLEYYGRNSIIVLSLHVPIISILKKIAYISFGIKPGYFDYNAAFALGLTLLNLFLMIPVIFLINNYFPFLMGRKRGSSTYFEGFKARLKKLVN